MLFLFTEASAFSPPSEDRGFLSPFRLSAQGDLIDTQLFSTSKNQHFPPSLVRGGKPALLFFFARPFFFFFFMASNAIGALLGRNPISKLF